MQNSFIPKRISRRALTALLIQASVGSLAFPVFAARRKDSLETVDTHHQKERICADLGHLLAPLEGRLIIETQALPANARMIINGHDGPWAITTDGYTAVTLNGPKVVAAEAVSPVGGLRGISRIGLEWDTQNRTIG